MWRFLLVDGTRLVLKQTGWCWNFPPWCRVLFLVFFFVFIDVLSFSMAFANVSARISVYLLKFIMFNEIWSWESNREALWSGIIFKIHIPAFQELKEKQRKILLFFCCCFLFFLNIMTLKNLLACTLFVLLFGLLCFMRLKKKEIKSFYVFCKSSAETGQWSVWCSDMILNKRMETPLLSLKPVK